MYSMPACAKKSVSFVNAAFTTLGAPETMGHDQVSMVFHVRRHVGHARVVDVVQRTLALLLVRVEMEDQLVDVSLDDL